jgi:hypothetical protein
LQGRNLLAIGNQHAIRASPKRRRRHRAQKAMLARQHSKGLDIITENATLEKFAL